MASKNYINNRKMFEVMNEYIEKCRTEDKRIANTEETANYPPIPDYIGECFMLIAKKLSNKFNFSRYPFKEEMISDGIENCCLYLRNFNPQKTENPFAYFTQIITFAFIRRIQKEKKQMYIKFKNFERLQLSDMATGQAVMQTEVNEISNAFIDAYEEKMLTNKQKSVKISDNVNKLFKE